jgi:hypothetical protein
MPGMRKSMSTTSGNSSSTRRTAVLPSGLIAFLLALYLFSWDSKNSKRRGHPALALLALAPYFAGILLL